MKAPMLFAAFLMSSLAAGASEIDAPQNYIARRVSSYDTTGGNHDFASVAPRSSYTAADIAGSGRIVHIWFTIATLEPEYLRTTRLKMFWDGRTTSAVDVPWGDFFALGHGQVRQIQSAFLTVVARPELNHNLKNKNVAGFNCYFPMPFAKGAKIVVENGSDQPITNLYYEIDYQVPKAPPSPLRFHARYHRTPPSKDSPAPHTILDVRGRGHLAGVVLSVYAIAAGWWEGDEMIRVDGEAKPSLHGTGTEDYFGGAWGFRREYNMPHHGVSYMERIPERKAWQAGRYTVYRFHKPDPVPFTKSLTMSIERGHENSRSDCEYTSVAYWYQE